MESPVTTYTDADLIVTDTGTKIHRSAAVHGAQNVVIAAKTIVYPSAIIRADLRRTGQGHAVAVAIGCFGHIHGTLLPPFKTYKGNMIMSRWLGVDLILSFNSRRRPEQMMPTDGLVFNSSLVNLIRITSSINFLQRFLQLLSHADRRPCHN